MMQTVLQIPGRPSPVRIAGVFWTDFLQCALTTVRPSSIPALQDAPSTSHGPMRLTER